MKGFNIFILFLFFALAGCVDPYKPPGTDPEARSLVVDGFINTGGPTAFKLSYTRSIGDTSKAVIPAGRVYVEEEGGASLELLNTGNGFYKIDQLNLNSSGAYRLKISLNDGKEYLSDFLEVKNTPDIDSVTWKRLESGVQIQVTSHDPLSKTQYYSYQYEETWKFHSAFYSGLKMVNGERESRPESEQIYYCFNSSKSTNILVASSDQLESDLIYKFPLTSLSTLTSNKLLVKYSILVKQRATTKEAFNYWNNLKKVTEELGSIFDPQPFTFSGNIHCVSDKNEIVLGFVSVTNEKEKRIFITSEQTGFTNIFTGYESCKLDTIPRQGITTIAPDQIPVTVVSGPGGKVITLVGTNACVDCRLRGTIEVPDFWE